MLIIKKFTIIFTAAIILLAAVNISAGADKALSDVQISARSAIVLEASTGQSLYEKNADSQMLVASTTKIMTALIALENASMEDLVEIPQECTGIEGSSLYLKSGEVCTMRELLYGLMLHSGNDAAMAVAHHISGSVEEFSKLMNDRAKIIGCENTHFVNPHGLDADGHYSTARDMAKITAVAMENELFEMIVSTKAITINNRTFKNHNKLLWMSDDTIGVKTGYTKSAGRILVSCAQRDGMRLICVTISAPDDWNDHQSLCETAFSDWQILNICSQDELVANLPVISGRKDDVGIVAADITESVLISKDTEITKKIYLPRFVYAGVKAGETAGRLVVTADGEEIFSTELLYSETVLQDKKQRLTTWERLKHSFGATVKKGMSGLGYENGN